MKKCKCFFEKDRKMFKYLFCERKNVGVLYILGEKCLFDVLNISKQAKSIKKLNKFSIYNIIR